MNKRRSSALVINIAKMKCGDGRTCSSRSFEEFRNAVKETWLFLFLLYFLLLRPEREQLVLCRSGRTRSPHHKKRWPRSHCWQITANQRARTESCLWERRHVPRRQSGGGRRRRQRPKFFLSLGTLFGFKPKQASEL